MSQSLFQRIAGTLSPIFRIGKQGPSIRQGTANPITSGETGNTGDVYLYTGNDGGVFQKTPGGWVPMSMSSCSSINISADGTTNLPNTASYVGVTASGNVNVVLATGRKGQTIVVKDEVGFSTPRTITVSSPELIDGQTSTILVTAYSSITLYFTTSWNLI